MTTWDKMLELVRRGYNFEVGPHSAVQGLTGFYAGAYRDSEVELCDNCDGRADSGWGNTQHAHTVEEAIELAIRAAEGEDIPVVESEEFRRQTRID